MGRLRTWVEGGNGDYLDLDQGQHGGVFVVEVGVIGFVEGSHVDLVGVRVNLIGSLEAVDPSEELTHILLIILMSENTLFNECRACKMKFQTRGQLENHVRKFCTESDYGDMERLEQKYQRELQALRKSQVPGARDFPEGQSQRQSQSGQAEEYGGLSLEALKEQAKLEDAEYLRLQREAQKARENEMDDELNKLRGQRKELRLKREDDEKAFQELLHELELKKEKEIRSKVEKDQIRKALMDLEKAKLSTIEQEKKRELERLVAEREALRAKENDLLDDIGKLEDNAKILDQMRQEEIKKVEGVIDGLKLKQGRNKEVNEQLLVDKSERVAALRLKRQQLEAERLRIMDNLDKIKSGDVKALKPGGLNLVSNAKNILNDMRDLANYNAGSAYQKIDDIHNQNQSFVRKNQLPFDADEAYASKPGRVDQAQAQYYDKYRNANTPGALGAFRENLEKNADQMMNQSLDVSMMNQSQRQVPPQQQRSFVQQPQQQFQQQPQQPSRLPAGPPSNQMEQLQNAWGMPLPQFQNNQYAYAQQSQVVAVPAAPNKQNTMFGQFALNQMHNGMNPATLNPSAKKKQAADPFDLFSRKHEFFLQNEVRGVDLTEEERCLQSLQAQEVDAMRILSRIPVGTELYRFKVEQFKELSTMRAEIEKIVQEQRLQDARRDFEMERREEDRVWENEKWVDDNRKFIIENRLRKDNTIRKKGQAGYDPSTGLVVHWDYTLGLPRRTNYGQIVFGVYNGQNALYQPRLVDPRESETESQNYNRVIIGDSHQIYEIPPHPDTLMIMEVQIPFSKRVEENVGRTETYGWTQVDLFDHNRQLKRGKFKCPVYFGPTDPSITVEEIQNLEPIPNCWVYFRVGYPNDKEFGIVKTIYPEQTMHEYIIPYIHLRGLFNKREAIQKRMQGGEYMSQYGGKQYKMIEEVIEESEIANRSGFRQEGEEVIELREPPPPMQNYKYEFEDQNKSGLADNGKKKGLRLIVYQVNNHQARSHLRVACALLEEGNLVLDDNGLPVAFNTTVHNPLDLRPEMRQNLAETYIIPLTTNNPEYNGMNNKAKGMDIIFQEEYRIFRNLYAMWRKNRKDIWIGLQVVEKPEPVELQDQSLTETHKNYGGLEFDLKGWQFLKISEEDGNFNTGRFKMRLYKPPIRRPPIDVEKVEEQEQIIDFALHEFEYDEADLAEFKKQMKRKRPPPPKQPEPKDVPLDNSPYIVNSKQQWVNKPFEKRMGVDFYIDGIRFAPDKVTVCKVYMEVYNKRYERIFESSGALPDLNSMSYMPVYHFRRELRKEHFDPTCVALLTVVTVDKSMNDNRIVGYAAINLFLNQYTKGQPENQNDDDYVLNNGAYQIPLFSQQLDRTPPFDIKKIYSHEKSPCCSVLVRINQAPLSEDGLRALSIEEFPNPKEQIRKGLMIPQPIYGQGAYNTELCPITESEKDLFAHRITRPDITGREAAYLLLKGEQINKEMKDREIYQYLDNRIYLTHDTFMIDMMYFAKYRPQAGFKFIVDGLHNVVNKNNVYVCFYSLSQPGAFYVEPRDVTQAHMSASYDWEAVINTPQYNDEWFKFKENANRYQNIIVDVKSVPASKVDGKITDVGWTVLPVFSPDGYIQSNIYQLPLYKGVVPRAVIEDLKKQDVQEYLQAQVKNKKIFFLEYMSVIVRLVDSQREGHFNKRLDCDRLEYKYLPPSTVKKWSYNPAVELAQKNDKKVSMLLPHKDNPAAFTRKITEYFANQFGLTQYLGS